MDQKPKISLMQVTARPGNIDILKANLDRQEFRDFEVILVDALWRDREQEVRTYLQDYDLVYVRQSDKRPGAHTNLAHADNEGFRSCTGELIVCLQDYIWILPDGLLKYWEIYQTNPNILVTGVGDQYAKPNATDIVSPQGKITIFEKSYVRRPEVKSWIDPRKRMDQGSFYMCNPQDWELNYCAIPRKVIYELGGMDERYDFHGFAWDNVNISVRADMLGYRAYIDQTNECMGFDHDGWWPNPLKIEKISPEKYHLEQMRKMANKETPIILEYLSETE